MATIHISDLTVSKELDGAAMTSVHGGRIVRMPKKYWGYGPTSLDFDLVNKEDNDRIKVKQRAYQDATALNFGVGDAFANNSLVQGVEIHA